MSSFPVTVAFLNSVYVRYVTRVQTFLTGVKLVALFIIIIAGIIQLYQGMPTQNNITCTFRYTNNSAN